MGDKTRGLKNFKTMTREEASEAGRKGGKRSGEVRREKRERYRSMSAVLKVLLELSLSKGKIHDINEIQAFAELKGKNVSVNEALMIRITQKALNGDLKAIEMIRDMMGEKPIDTVHIADVTPVIISGENEIEE